MADTQFDEYKTSYASVVETSVSFSGQDHAFFTEVKARELLHSLARLGKDPSQLSILDIGCGPGATDSYLTSKFKQLTGVDISPGILEAAAKANPTANYVAYDGLTLPFEDETFDVAFAICVVHHVPPLRWESFVREMKRVTRPGGLCYIFEHNPLNPLTRKAVRDCEFDQDAVLLKRAKTTQLMLQSGLQTAEQRYILFTPFRGEAFRKFDSALHRFPLGAQYFVCGKRQA